MLRCLLSLYMKQLVCKRDYIQWKITVVIEYGASLSLINLYKEICCCVAFCFVVQSNSADQHRMPMLGKSGQRPAVSVLHKYLNDIFKMGNQIGLLVESNAATKKPFTSCFNVTGWRFGIRCCI